MKVLVDSISSLRQDPVAALQDSFSLSALLSLLGLSLVYGFVHALSPGHGKTIHVGSAIVLSLGMWLILSHTALRGEGRIENVLRIVAGFLLVDMGLREVWVALRARRGKEVSHRHAALLPLGIGPGAVPDFHVHQRWD